MTKLIEEGELEYSSEESLDDESPSSFEDEEAVRENFEAAWEAYEKSRQE